jgi:hypothetical protein
MSDMGLLLRSGLDGVRMSYIAAMLAGEGIETDLRPQGQGFNYFRLYIRPEDAVRARAVLRALDASPPP